VRRVKEGVRRVKEGYAELRKGTQDSEKVGVRKAQEGCGQEGRPRLSKGAQGSGRIRRVNEGCAGLMKGAQG
jgi:hypothetical protein